MGELDGKVCVLVGGGGGIGEATAVAYCPCRRCGRRRCGHSAGARGVGQREVGDLGTEAWGTRVDALEEGALDALLDDVVHRHGRVDVMHNLTSTTVLVASTELPLAEFEKVFRATVVGQFAGRRPRRAG